MENGAADGAYAKSDNTCQLYSESVGIVVEEDDLENEWVGTIS